VPENTYKSEENLNVIRKFPSLKIKDIEYNELRDLHDKRRKAKRYTLGLKNEVDCDTLDTKNSWVYFNYPLTLKGEVIAYMDETKVKFIKKGSYV